MKIIKITLCLLAGFAICTHLNANNSCEIMGTIHGHAAEAGVTGGEGMTNYVITNTNNSGTGSYREALSQGNRYITFDPSLANQTINLNSAITTNINNITLDGSDAPGITISKYATKFEGTNIIVAYMNYHDMDATSNQDGITFRNAPSGGQIFYVYKCHFKNATDGNIDVIWNRGNDVYFTVSHCKFEQTDKSFLVHAGSGSEGGTYYGTVDNNWFYRVGQRAPFGRDFQLHYYNNLLEAWGSTNNNGGGAYSGDNSKFLVENNIAIAASPGDPDYSGATIITPKQKAFASQYTSTTGAIKNIGNLYINDAYGLEQFPETVPTPTYNYTLQNADSQLESYLRNNANSVCNVVSTCTVLPDAEGFESGFGQWSQSGDDDLDWTRNSGGTASGSTGPTSASEGIWYMYIEASGGGTGHPFKTAGLVSPCLDLMGIQTANLSFQYHIRSDVNDMILEVQISTNDGQNWSNALWSRTGNQGSQWNSATVNLNAYLNQNILIRFWGTTGETYKSDISIDDILIDTQTSACTPGTTCTDSDPCTINDMYGTDCNCIGTYTDTDNDGVCIGNDSDDNDPCVPNPCNGGDCELLTNTNFDNALQPDWDYWGCNATSANGIAAIRGIVNGENVWEAALFTDNILVEQGENYEVKFRARANANRTMDIKVGQNQSPYVNYLYQRVNLTTSMQDFTFNFTMNRPTDNNTAFDFFVAGGNTANIYIDNASLTKINCYTGSPKEDESLTFSFDLYPNPANHSIQLTCELSKNTQAQIQIYDAFGKLVKHLTAVELVTGSPIDVDVTQLPAGMYFCTLKSGKWQTVKKFVITR